MDLSAGYEVISGLSLYGSASYNNSEVQNDIQISSTLFAPTAGKELVETPEWTFSSRAQYTIGPFSVGVQGKYVDERWATDINDEKSPSYTIFDADARYDFSAFGMASYVQLNVSNLADKKYIGSINATRFAKNGTPYNATSGDPQYVIGATRTFQVSFGTMF